MLAEGIACRMQDEISNIDKMMAHYRNNTPPAMASAMIALIQQIQQHFYFFLDDVLLSTSHTYLVLRLAKYPDKEIVIHFQDAHYLVTSELGGTSFDANVAQVLQAIDKHLSVLRNYYINLK